jgi:hypothetical protein
MKKPEKAVFINNMDDLPSDMDRIYCGNEFCQKLIPDVKELARWCSFADTKGLDLTFVTPFVTNVGLEQLGVIFDYLESQKDMEVVFNDWGVFRLLTEKYKNIKPIVGRLLTKQRRDPRWLFFSKYRKARKVFNASGGATVLVPKKIPEETQDHFSSSIYNSEIFQEYLVENNVQMVEIDNLPWETKIDKNKKISISLYYPYEYIATTRMCGKVTLSYGRCDNECKKYFLKVKEKALPEDFYNIGNTVFYKSDLDPAQVENAGVDRIVFQPYLPF